VIGACCIESKVGVATVATPTLAVLCRDGVRLVTGLDTEAASGFLGLGGDLKTTL
jgi:hypothetical protein